MKDIKGKVAVVTGSAMGMGRKISELLARKGARVAMIDLNSEALEKAAGELKSQGMQVYPYVLNITDRQKVYAVAEQIRREVGPADILVNSAGVVCGSNFLDTPDEKFLWTMDVNVNGIIWMTKAFLPDMVAKQAGHVVNLASAGGIMGIPRLSSYCASKFAVVGLTETIRMEMKKDRLNDIHFTIVCPSYVSTGMFAGARPPRFAPWLSPETMAEKIFRAIIEERDYVLEPFWIKLAPFFKAILPSRTIDKYNIKSGVASSMKRWTGRQ